MARASLLSSTLLATIQHPSNCCSATHIMSGQHLFILIVVNAAVCIFCSIVVVVCVYSMGRIVCALGVHQVYWMISPCILCVHSSTSLVYESVLQNNNCDCRYCY